MNQLATDHESHKKYSPEICAEAEVEMIERGVEGLLETPTTYTKQYTSRIMDAIETLEAVIGVERGKL